VRLIKEKTQHLRQHHIVDIVTSSISSGLTGEASSGRSAVSNPSVRLSCQSASGSRVIRANGAQPKRVSAMLADSRISAISAVSGKCVQEAGNQMALRSRVRKRGDELIGNHHDSSIGARIRAA
jgi:hypothetical protein